MLTDVLTNLIVKALAWLFERWKKSRTPAPPVVTTNYVNLLRADTCGGCGWLSPDHDVGCPRVEERTPGRPSVGIAQPPEMIPSTFSRLTEEELEDLWHGHRS